MKRLILLVLLVTGIATAQGDLLPLGEAFEIRTAWKAHVGGDPQWAKPDFDDSSWQGPSALPQLDGLTWYRMAVRLPDGQGPFGLWIPNVLKAAEFYANGVKIGEHGSIHQWYLERRDTVDPIELPASFRGGDLLHLAVRVKRVTTGPGIPRPPVIGSWFAVKALYEKELLSAYRQSFLPILLSVLHIGAFLLALIYWGGRKSRQEALWLGALFLDAFFADFEAYRRLGALQGWTLLAGASTTAALWGGWRFFNGAPFIPWRRQLPYLFFLFLLFG